MYYKSRYHISNGLLSLSFDSSTGELLEFNNPSSGENLIKNHSYALPQPFAIETGDGRTLRPGDAGAIARFPQLRARVEAAEDGRSLRAGYSWLWDGSRPCAQAAEFTVELPEGKADSVWRLSLENHGPEVLKDVRFPCVNGVYLGETWEDDTLVYPYVAGVKVQDPVTAFSRGQKVLCWRWQDYKYIYTMGALGGELGGGLFGVENNYSGLLSMKWLDYYGEDFGFYFGCHDRSFGICNLRADTLGAAQPGMNFSFRFPLNLKMGEAWHSPETVAALHPGDWHEGADRYRAFHRELLPAGSAQPEWFKTSPGLVAHYDFKYQNGGVVHRFEDINRLLDEARELGINHLLMAGWHHDGFDHGFPEYYPAEDLGTKEELRQQVQELIARGGHVCFYINSRLANLKYEHLWDFIAKNGIRLADGTIFTEQYGTGDLRFAAMCIGSGGWQDKLADTVRYVTGEEIGIDGVYLDQLAMGSAGLCANPEHDHSFGQWNTGYQKLLRRLHAQREQEGRPMISTIHEGCSDSYGPLVSGQLVSTFSYHHNGAFPELYRYTFPEQMLVDMLYPGRNLAMRPVHVAQASRAIMDRAFCLGMYYWIYDLVDDNTFTRDPEGYEYLRRMVALRRFWLETFGQGEYQDAKGLAVEGRDVRVCRYQVEGGVLLACANASGEPARAVLIGAEASGGVCYTADTLPKGAPAAVERTGDGISLALPEAPLSLIFLRD